jgi:hypothetical protein
MTASHTLTHATTVIALPEEYTWPDRYKWSPVIRKEDYGCGDGEAAPLIVDVFKLATGRPITLKFERMTRATVDALFDLAALPGVNLIHQQPGEAPRTVQFRGSEPLQVEEKLVRVPAQPDDILSLTMNLIEVS